MDRRSFLLALAGGAAAASTLGATAASAAPASSDVNDLDAVRAALGAGEPVEMQRRRGRHGGGFRRRHWRGPRRHWHGPRRYYWRPRPYWGPRRYYWRRRYWGGPRRCWINRWGVWVCRRPRPIWW